MNNKELRKLNRKELLEIILDQAKRINELEDKLKKTQTKLESRKIAIDEVGSIAEAALKLNGIFDSAQETADLYLTNAKDKCKKMENQTKKECQEIKEKMLQETEKICQEKKQAAEEYLNSIKHGRTSKTTKNKKDNNTKKTVKLAKKKIVQVKPATTVKKGNVR